MPVYANAPLGRGTWKREERACLFSELQGEYKQATMCQSSWKRSTHLKKAILIRHTVCRQRRLWDHIISLFHFLLFWQWHFVWGGCVWITVRHCASYVRQSNLVSASAALSVRTKQHLGTLTTLQNERLNSPNRGEHRQQTFAFSLDNLMGRILRKTTHLISTLHPALLCGHGELQYCLKLLSNIRISQTTFVGNSKGSSASRPLLVSK